MHIIEELLITVTIYTMTGAMLGILMAIITKHHDEFFHDKRERHYVFDMPLVILPAYIMLSALSLYIASVIVGFSVLYIFGNYSDMVLTRVASIGVSCIFYILMGFKSVHTFIK